MKSSESLNLSKREFYERYASKKDRDSVKSTAYLAYICAAISLVVGIIQKNYAVVFDIVLVVGLGCGIQFARSRVCALLLLIYGCINTIFFFLATGKIAGWWLIFVGVWGVRTTFQLHKAYRQFLADGTIPQSNEPQKGASESQDRPGKGKMVATMAPFIALFPSIGLLWFSLSPVFLNFLLGDAPSPEALLRGYSHWYVALIGAVIVSVLIVVAGVAISIWKGMRDGKAITLMAISLAFPIFLGGFMLAGEGVPTLLSQAQDDIRQIESDDLQQVTVWLSPKIRPGRLPGPYGEGQPQPVTRYGGYSDETGGRWVDFYVPDVLDFSLDQDALFNENESIDWNEANAAKYRLSYTKYFNLVTSVERVDE